MGERQIDPFAFENDENDDDKEADALRKDRNRLGKALRDAQGEIDRLKPFEALELGRQKESTLAEKFKDAGVEPRRVKIFTALNKDVDPDRVTKEQIQSFAREEGFEVQEKVEGETESTGDEGGEEEGGFKPVTSPTSTKPTGSMNREDWLKLAATDPKAAEAAFNAGQVDLSDVTAGLGPDK